MINRYLYPLSTVAEFLYNAKTIPEIFAVAIALFQNSHKQSDVYKECLKAVKVCWAQFSPREQYALNNAHGEMIQPGKQLKKKIKLTPSGGGGGGIPFKAIALGFLATYLTYRFVLRPLIRGGEKRSLSLSKH